LERIDLQRILWHIVSFTVKLVTLLVLVSTRLNAQAVEVYSEFWPFANSSAVAREIISPAVARNGFSTFKVLVRAPAGKSFFLFCETNPPNLVEARLYKIGAEGRLELVRSPNFGVIPDEDNSRAYLLDIRIPADAEPGRRVRLELQLKMGDWIVYPLELRIQRATVPLSAIEASQAPLSLPAMTERNRRQDRSLEELLNLPEVWFLTAQHIVNGWTEHSPLSTADDPEWYLRVRDLMYRRANTRKSQ